EAVAALVDLEARERPGLGRRDALDRQRQERLEDRALHPLDLELPGSRLLAALLEHAQGLGAAGEPAAPLVDRRPDAAVEEQRDRELVVGDVGQQAVERQGSQALEERGK